MLASKKNGEALPFTCYTTESLLKLKSMEYAPPRELLRE